MDKDIYIIDEEFKGQRIDKYLNEVYEDFSRSKLQKMIEDSYVLVNGAKTKANYKLAVNDEITVIMVDPVDYEVVAEDIPLDIYYEDNDVIVVNKPSGMVVHPAPGNPHGTLVNGILHHCQDLSGINGVLRPGVVHRIDKDTSGLLMLAKNDKAHVDLADQLRNKTVERRYIALVHGVIPHETGTIDAPIGRDSKDRKRMDVTEKNSKEAVTHFVVLERFNDFTLIECKLETGRTHQIRVHMKYIGHPVAGDPLYAPRKTIGENGQFLHAKTLGFIHPTTKEYIEFEAPIPQDFEDMINHLRNETQAD